MALSERAIRRVTHFVLIFNDPKEDGLSIKRSRGTFEVGEHC